jgi:hypothetical protein
MTTAAMKIAVSTGAIVHIGSSDALFLRPRSLQLCALISVLIWIKPSSRYSPGPAIGTVRPQRQLFHQQGNVLSRNCKAGRIGRSRDRRIFELPPKPSSQLKPIAPQRRPQELLEKALPLPGVEPPPAFQRRLSQISAPHLA